jgi:FlaA1/EpsC-like NDP-sugar epimerase
MMQISKRVFALTPLKRRVFFLISDLAIIGLSLYASFWLRFDGLIPIDYLERIPFFLILAYLVKIPCLAAFGMYGISWRFFGLIDFIKLVASILVSSSVLSFILLAIRKQAPFTGFPRAVLLADFVITLGALGIFRISKRAVLEFSSNSGRLRSGRIRILVVGAGEAGSTIARDMLVNKKSKYYPIGFIDDDFSKRGMSIQGVRVLGTRHDIPALLKANAIDEVLIAIPTFRSADIRTVVGIIRNAGGPAKIKVLPSILELVDGNVTLADIKEVQVEDLLGRDKVEIDFALIREFLNRKRVLITGAGGSIGSELARTVLQYEPRSAALLDIDETELFYLTNRFHGASTEVFPVIADIRDRAKIESIFSEFRPEIILHSAAYKHVPVLESFPEEAVKTNVLGTKILGELALKYGVERFVYISTDKAINPTSVMGATKRVGEEMLRVLNGRNGTKFISVRFGNVLGSRGSVIPVFENQIKRGGPVTVTHPEMKRYFMATSEAVLLVLEAAAIGRGGETFILDMGEPIKILDLAREMIRLSGHEPDVDIPIVFSGLRPGEKLYEELLGAEEGSEPTDLARIFKAHNPKVKPDDETFHKIEALINGCREHRDRGRIVQGLIEIVPTYKPQAIGTGANPGI